MGQIDHLLRGVSASLEGSIAREEEAAALDLATSFLQGRTLRELMEQRAALYVLGEGGQRTPVTVLGADFAGTGDPLTKMVNLGTVVLVCGRAEAPFECTDRTWVEVARGWRSRRVVVEVGERLQVAGRLELVGADHLILSHDDDIICPASSVRSIRLSREG